MFVNASWIAIVAALCVAQTHAAQAAKPADAIGISTLIHDANGKAIGSAATYFDKNGTVIGSETTYFTEAPAAVPAVAGEAAKSADAPAKPAYHHGTASLIRDANGKEIGSLATYYDKDGNVIETKPTYWTQTPAAAPAVAGEAKSADAPAKPKYHHGKSTIIYDANGKSIGSMATYYDKDGNVIETKITYDSDAPAPAPAFGTVKAA